MRISTGAHCYDANFRYIGQVPAQDCDPSGQPRTLPAGAVGYTLASPSGLRAPIWDGSAWQHGETAEEARAKIPDADLAAQERAWRDQQLAAADVELAKIADADPKQKGTDAAWRTYRKALRALPELPGFPRTHTRPEAPQ